MTAPTPARQGGARLSVAGSGGPAGPGGAREQVRAWAELLGFGQAAADGSAGTAPVRRGRLAPVPAAVDADAATATGRGPGTAKADAATGTGTGTATGTGPGTGRGPGTAKAGAIATATGTDTATATDTERGTGTGRGTVPAAAARSAAAPARRPSPADRLRAWAELLRVPAVFTVPGDALAGAAAAAVRPGRRTGLAVAASLCLYEAGMALNDWADREEDAVARPHRPLPSGRIRPGAALAAAGALTAAGLALAARAGRPALAVAAPLAVTVWAYDLKLKHTPAGPAAMAAARSLDLLLGAAASAGTVRPALRPALLLGGHTYAVTQVSRREAEGGSTAAPLAALAATTVLGALLGRGPGPRRTQAAATQAAGTMAAATSAIAPTPAPTAHAQTSVARTPMHAAQVASATGRTAPASAQTSVPAPTPTPAPQAVPDPVSAPVGAGRGPQGEPVRVTGRRFGAGDRPGGSGPLRPAAGDLIRVGLAAAYWRGFARPLGHAVLNPSPVLTQRAVGGGIRAMIPLQGALMAGAGAPLAGVATIALAPFAARLARKVSTT